MEMTTKENGSARIPAGYHAENARDLSKLSRIEFLYRTGSLPDLSGQPRGTPWMDGESTPAGTMFVFFGNAVPMPKVASTLQGMVQRPVVDKTNLKGFFDFRIRFSPSAIPAFPDRTASNDGTPAVPSDHPLVPILQDQLGLRL